MKKKMCDHPAGLLFAVIVTIIFSFVNYYSMGNMQTTVLLAVAIVVIYFVFCLLCRAREAEEDKEK